MHNIETGQAVKTYITGDHKLSLDNKQVLEKVNASLNHELSSEALLTPTAGFQKIRKVLHFYGMDMPALYDAIYDGDEVFFEVSRFDGSTSAQPYFLYLVYYMEDLGKFHFHAEVVNQEELNDIIHDESEDDDDDDDETCC